MACREVPCVCVEHRPVHTADCLCVLALRVILTCCTPGLLRGAIGSHHRKPHRMFHPRKGIAIESSPEGGCASLASTKSRSVKGFIPRARILTSQPNHKDKLVPGCSRGRECGRNIQSPLSSRLTPVWVTQVEGTGLGLETENLPL